MKLKDILGNVVENKTNGQWTTSIKKNQLKKAGISRDDLLNMQVDSKLKKCLFKK
jgi:hypothetical protein